jgi:hypothetical protein
MGLQRRTLGYEENGLTPSSRSEGGNASRFHDCYSCH